MRKAVLLLLPLVAACASTPTYNIPAPTGPATRPAPVAPPPQTPPPTVSAGFRAPKVMQAAGLESVIGRDAQLLTNQFGSPRLTVREGDAIKLQFVGPACVLDVYLYPMREGAVPTATYVDARRSSDGLDVDRASCVRALIRR